MSDTHDRRAGAAESVPGGTVLGFDFGTRKIGVAVGNTITGAARALTTVRDEPGSARRAAIGALIVDWAPVALVTGRPLHADGSTHAVTALADAFAQELRQRFALPVEQVDERYTTQIADIERKARGRYRGEADRDAHAAAIILQAWLDARSHAAPQT
ncbi:MAG: Holliday junction resolvase RuvX [Casimicrobiaceae bacterium]